MLRRQVLWKAISYHVKTVQMVEQSVSAGKLVDRKKSLTLWAAPSLKRQGACIHAGSARTY